MKSTILHIPYIYCPKLPELVNDSIEKQHAELPSMHRVIDLSHQVGGDQKR